MIIGTDRPFKLGEQGKSIYHKKKYYAQPFVVLREATREEWKAGAIEDGATAAECDHALRMKPHAYFYEVSID